MQVFQRCASQWRVGFSGPTGLDYAAVDAVLRHYGPEDPAECFWRLQVLEYTTLSIMADRRPGA